MAEAAEQVPEEVSMTMLPPEAVLGLRAVLTEHLNRAIAEDVAPIESSSDVLAQAIGGRTRIWLIHESNEILGVVTTVMLEHPRFKVARVLYMAGKDLDRWQTLMIDTLKAFARDQECEALEWFAGRRGWTKRAKEVGAVPIGTLYRMGLED